jgi:hypothetical protein
MLTCCFRVHTGRKCLSVDLAPELSFDRSLMQGCHLRNKRCIYKSVFYQVVSVHHPSMNGNWVGQKQIFVDFLINEIVTGLRIQKISCIVFV